MAVFWTLLCIFGITLGLLATARSWSLPIPEYIVKDIQTVPVLDVKTSDDSGTAPQHP